MTGGGASFFQLKAAKRQIEVIVKYQKPIERNTQSSEKIREGRAAFVHVRRPWDGKYERFSMAVNAAEIAVRFFPAADCLPNSN